MSSYLLAMESAEPTGSFSGMPYRGVGPLQEAGLTGSGCCALVEGGMG